MGEPPVDFGAFQLMVALVPLRAALTLVGRPGPERTLAAGLAADAPLWPAALKAVTVKE